MYMRPEKVPFTLSFLAHRPMDDSRRSTYNVRAFFVQVRWNTP
jgi:hypothetical protein